MENQFSTSTNFTGLDFNGTWVMSNGFDGDSSSFTRPVLLYNCESTGEIHSGDGTAGDPYKIPNLATLEYYRDEINGADKEAYGSACYLLIANIGLGGEGGDSWEPIGLHTGPFNGRFDGGNHIISGLYIYDTTDTYRGLFGSIDSEGTVKNLTVSGSVTGREHIGGIAGESFGTISNCTSNCSVSGVSYVGGIAGSSSTISGCKNYGSVSSSDRGAYAGGIAGSSGGGVSNCYNTARVSGGAANSIGGVAGVNSGSVRNCYSSGAASGVAGSGGGSVSNCYYLAESETDTIEGTTFKTAEQFASGEVAWLLQSKQNDDVWGQDIGEDASPLLTAQSRVYRALFMNGTTEHAARYCNSGGKVSLPDAPDAPSGQAFDGWFDGDTEFTEATVINSDMTLTARFSNILVSYIRLSSASLTLQVGSTHTLTATVEPEGAANREITWSSSDTSVATVGDSGLVTAAGVGTATITASAQDGSGVSAECTVTVTPLPTYTVAVNDSYAAQSGAGSYVEGASVTVSAGERADYRFAGWTAVGIDLADASAATVTFNMPAHGVTLTASWDYINVPDPTYKPIVDVPEGVEVTTDPARPEPGDTVTVTTDPAGSISVTDKDGNNVDVTRNPDGSWSFTQPEGAVTITFTPDSGLPFTDVADGAWYYDGVRYVYASSLMDGTSDTAFNPNANMTRAMVWAILARVDGETVTGANWV